MNVPNKPIDKLTKLRYGLSAILLGTSITHILTGLHAHTMFDGLGSAIALFLTMYLLS